MVANELVERYLKKVEKVKGLYVLSADQISHEEMMKLLNCWREFEATGKMDCPLVVIPSNTMLSHEDFFTFERAIQIVRASGRVRRVIWHPEEYLELDCDDGVSLFRGTDCLCEYVMKQDDLEAADWVLYDDYE